MSTLRILFLKDDQLAKALSSVSSFGILNDPNVSWNVSIGYLENTDNMDTDDTDTYT